MAKKKKESSEKKSAVKKKQQAKVSTKNEGKKKEETKKEMKKKETLKADVKKPIAKSGTKKEEQKKSNPVVRANPQSQSSQNASSGAGKKRLMISYEKLPHEVIEVIRTKYPYGYNHDLKEVKGLDNKKFFVLPIELPDVVYLVKVDLRKPIKIQEADDEEDIFTAEEDFGGEEDNFPAEDLEQIEAEDEGEGEVKKKKRRNDNEDDDDEV